MVGMLFLHILRVTRRSDAATDKITTTLPARPIEDWSIEELTAWRKENNLSGETINNLTQQQFAYYTNMSKRAPEFFYRTLDKDLEIRDRELKANYTAAVYNVLTRDIVYQQEDEAVKTLQKTKWKYDSVDWTFAISANIMTILYLKPKIASLWRRRK